MLIASGCCCSSCCSSSTETFQPSSTAPGLAVYKKKKEKKERTEPKEGKETTKKLKRKRRRRKNSRGRAKRKACVSSQSLCHWTSLGLRSAGETFGRRIKIRGVLRDGFSRAAGVLLFFSFGSRDPLPSLSLPPPLCPSPFHLSNEFTNTAERTMVIEIGPTK